MNNKALLAIWTILLICFRPSIFGEDYNPVIFLLFILVSFFIILKRKYVFKTNLSSGKFYTAVIVLITTVYFSIQGFILSDTRITVLNATIVIIGTILCFILIINDDNKFTILRTFINIHFVLSISMIITFLLFLILGMNDSNLPVMAKIGRAHV